MSFVWDEMKISCRLPGFIYGYTGTVGTAQGWLEDFDGKWVYLSLDTFRTIGSAASGAHLAYDWLQFLFIHLWSNYSNSQCVLLTSAGVSTARGASAAADWSANTRLTLPDYRGRTLIVAGTGVNLTSRSKGTSLGTETVTLSTAQLPVHSHAAPVFEGASGHIHSSFNTGFAAAPSPLGTQASSGIISNTGLGQEHDNMQPSLTEHLLISAGMR